MDHPHGGGRGKSKSNRHPTTPWGKPVSSSMARRDESLAQKADTLDLDQERLENSAQAQHQQLGGDAAATQPRKTQGQEVVVERLRTQVLHAGGGGKRVMDGCSPASGDVYIT